MDGKASVFMDDGMQTTKDGFRFVADMKTSSQENV